MEGFRNDSQDNESSNDGLEFVVHNEMKIWKRH